MAAYVRLKIALPAALFQQGDQLADRLLVALVGHERGVGCVDDEQVLEAECDDQVFVVEQNRDAQMRSLLVNECGIDPVRLVPILHYDGTPITARYIARAIGDHLDALKVTPLRKAMS